MSSTHHGKLEAVMSNLYAILIIHIVQPLPPFYDYVSVKWALAIHADLRKYVIEISHQSTKEETCWSSVFKSSLALSNWIMASLFV
jgi:hypothetical protein